VAAVSNARHRGIAKGGIMLLDVIYSIPTWLLGVIIGAVASALPGGALWLVQRRVPAEVRHAHNEVAGFISAVVGVIYAVVLAFVAIVVWEQFGEAEATVRHEANAVSDVFRGSLGYPEPLRRRIRDRALEYVRAVIDEEWKLQARGHVSPEARKIVEALQKDLLEFEPGTLREQVVHAEQLRHMNALLDQRRLRFAHGESGIQPVVWVVILLGGALVASYACFLGTENVRAHLAMTAVLGASIGLVILLIVALDYPFRGSVSIGPEAFERVRQDMERLAAE
jgi:hypothetical protein